jgi:cytochrome d ubiquinol oxidase subunit II
MDLQAIWFFLWVLLWAIYFVTDGFDLGMGILLPFIAKDDMEKRVIYNAAGPLWDGNEVWLITAGGVTFAAFPLVYAVMFSSLYSALLLVLFALILRGVSLEFRGKIDSAGWKRMWDGCMFVGSLVPAVLLGVAFANIFRGIPIDGAGVYHGTLFTLLNPYGLLGGVLFLFLVLVHGALWLAIKSEGALHERAVRTAKRLWPLLLASAVVFLAASGFSTDIYRNYLAHPVLFVFILTTVLALLATRVFLAKGALWKAWFSSAVTIMGACFYGFIGLFPRMFPSSLNPDFSLTAYNAASSPPTLKIMLVLALIFVPIVIIYQVWAYNLFKGKVTKEDLSYDEAY